MSNPGIPFQNVEISVIPNSEKEGEYIVTANPDEITITQCDTIINYQIVETGGYDIVFTGMTVTPNENGQLSQAIVSVDGKMLTLSDINTVEMNLNIDLKFKDNSKKGLPFSHDPQVRNRPQPLSPL